MLHAGLQYQLGQSSPYWQLPYAGARLVGWLVGFLTSSSTTRLYRGRAPRQERLTILRAATHETELGDHGFCFSRSHYTDTDPTSRERAATAGIELGSSSPGVARSTAELPHPPPVPDLVRLWHVSSLHHTTCVMPMVIGLARTKKVYRTAKLCLWWRTVRQSAWDHFLRQNCIVFHSILPANF